MLAIIIVILAVVFDQISKYLVVEAAAPVDSLLEGTGKWAMDFIPRVLSFSYAENKGGGWSILNGGGWERGKTWAGATGIPGDAYWVNNWDFPNDDRKNYTQCFEDKIKPQVTELMTRYGDICLIWFDTPSSISPAQSRELYDLVKHYQPECLVNSRIGNGLGDYCSTGDNEVNFDPSTKNFPLFECPATLNDTWGYKSFDNNWKTKEQVLCLLDRLNARGINYLLNVGPDALGRIPGPAQDIFRAVGEHIHNIK